MNKNRVFRALAILAALLLLGATGVTAQEVECEWMDETAWADGDRYVPRGNWATFTEYNAGAMVTLYAGRYLEAGTVHFSAVVDGNVTITITLNEGWRFEDVEENVKIQDYELEPPAENPTPGWFAYKDYATESPFSIVVPASSFYGIHVNVELEYCFDVEAETDLTI
jgi:putative cofactor-binding repeat protein